MSKQPNIVIFNPDQFRGDVLGHMGNPAAITPNLDRFANEDAVSFRNAYCQLPVCTPSRCSFMSGWYPHVRGHRSQLHMMREGEPVLLKYLKDNGYFVWWGGKNDLVPSQYGFDKYCNVKYQIKNPETLATISPEQLAEWRGKPDSDSYYSFYYGKADKGDKEYFRDGDWGNIEGALDFLESRDNSKPFCLYLPLSYPHPPYLVEDPWFSMINKELLPLRRMEPTTDADKAGIINAMAEKHNLRGWSEERWDQLRSVYYGMCARIDHQFGLILEMLKKKNFFNDTAVFFFSDHGDFTGDYNLVNKNYNVMDDPLTKVPFLFKPSTDWAVKPGIRNALVELVDFPATVFEFTGIEPDYWHFGKSLLPLAADENVEHRDAVFCEGGRLINEKIWDQFSVQLDKLESLYWPPISALATESPICTKATMCRTSRYKYVHRLYEKDEFYDLETDPLESTNLVEKPEIAPVLAEHKDRIMRFYLETGDVVPFDLDHR